MAIRIETPAGRTSGRSRKPAHATCPTAAYPKARDVAQHGMQPLPSSLPLVDFARAEPYRSSRYSTVLATELTRNNSCRWRG